MQLAWLAAEHSDKITTSSDGPGKLILAIVIIMALWGGYHKPGGKQ